MRKRNWFWPLVFLTCYMTYSGTVWAAKNLTGADVLATLLKLGFNNGAVMQVNNGYYDVSNVSVRQTGDYDFQINFTAKPK